MRFEGLDVGRQLQKRLQAQVVGSRAQAPAAVEQRSPERRARAQALDPPDVPLLPSLAQRLQQQIAELRLHAREADEGLQAVPAAAGEPQSA